MSAGLRRTARECALRTLYAHDVLRLVECPIPPYIEVNWWDTDDSLYVPPEARQISLEWVTRVDAQLEQIDEFLSGTSRHWRVERMPLVERNILRLAVMELFECPETQHPVIINEAIELAKCYGDVESPRFVNGVLDRVAHAARDHDHSEAFTF